MVVAAAFVARDGHILMHRRNRNSVHGGLWEFPGGKIEKAESPETALVREINEELGVAVELRDLAPVAFASGETAGPDARAPLVILLYTCRKWSGNPRCLEGEEIAWFAPEELAELDMPPLDYPLAAQLVRYLSS